MNKSSFEWNDPKDKENFEKHDVSFQDAQYAFFDECRVIAEDVEHGQSEKRFFLFWLK